MTVAQLLITEASYVEIIVGIIVALILVSFWQRAIENWLFETLGIDRKSTFQTLVIAVISTLFFFVFINVIESFARDIVLGVTEAGADGTMTGSPFGSTRSREEPKNNTGKNGSLCDENESRRSGRKSRDKRCGDRERSDIGVRLRPIRPSLYREKSVRRNRESSGTGSTIKNN